ncbi:MAG: hypothetical protein SCARUB_04164 [Candidatus Scalindua rubra]|uniref:Uncharacterized protein n=1 Tax=Candidatus Scalindua rubra TaxID=1872076 RepID=A0A1E3X521_9BACT|nr:MAG: hypothetical protein SCARUB_04164 [Candidatus Scalindua rubra]
MTEPIKEQPMVRNSKTKELKKEKAARARELHRLKVQLADNIVNESKDKVNLEDIKKDKIHLFADIAGIDNEILFIDKELDKLPAMVARLRP